MNADQNKDLAYYLTLFTLAGHTTWRAHLSMGKETFDNSTKDILGKNPPKITAKHMLRIDRITGQIQPQ